MRLLLLLLICFPTLLLAIESQDNKKEMMFIHITIITLIALVIITDQFLKYIFRKMREREALQDEEDSDL